MSEWTKEELSAGRNLVIETAWRYYSNQVETATELACQRNALLAALVKVKLWIARAEDEKAYNFPYLVISQIEDAIDAIAAVKREQEEPIDKDTTPHERVEDWPEWKKQAIHFNPGAAQEAPKTKNHLGG